LDESDPAAAERYGNIRLEFRTDGTLFYTIVDSAKHQTAVLSFRVEGDILITDQPSAPREHRTHFEIAPDGRLFLDDDQGGAYYVRTEANSIR
jgi:hypothetical protein